MTNWRRFWSTFPLTVGRYEYRKQVKSTVGGVAISDLQFDLGVEEACLRLDLKSEDIVLDLCCGNGLITRELAKRCRAVVGVDFSPALLEVANADHRPPNVRYLNLDARSADQVPEDERGPFTKAIMSSALQHFRRSDLLPLLATLSKMLSGPRMIVFTGVPNSRNKWTFYNTTRRRLQYALRKIMRKEMIGTWWNPDQVARACRTAGLSCEFHVSADEETARYRFDFVAGPGAVNG